MVELFRNLGTKLLLSCESCAALCAPERAVFCLWHVVTPLLEINPQVHRPSQTHLSITTSGARASKTSGWIRTSAQISSGEPIQQPLPARKRQGVRCQPRSGKFPSPIFTCRKSPRCYRAMLHCDARRERRVFHDGVHSEDGHPKFFLVSCMRETMMVTEPSTWESETKKTKQNCLVFRKAQQAPSRRA